MDDNDKRRAKYQAWHKKPASQDEPKQRKCLGTLCGGKMFKSTWVGNRLCERCTNSIRHDNIDITVHGGYNGQQGKKSTST